MPVHYDEPPGTEFISAFSLSLFNILAITITLIITMAITITIDYDGAGYLIADIGHGCGRECGRECGCGWGRQRMEIAICLAQLYFMVAGVAGRWCCWWMVLLLQLLLFRLPAEWRGDGAIFIIAMMRGRFND